MSPEHRAALKCEPGCTCAKHALRNDGQFRTGGTGFVRPHTDETRAKLAEYSGQRASAYEHGWADTPTYWTWSCMKSRCDDPRNASYVRYGAAGIKVCDRWYNFVAFLADMGPRPAGKTLDRIDNAKGYEPGNCRWATKAEQTANRRPPRK